MIVLAPILSGKENSPEFIEALCKADKILLLTIVDREFAMKTTSAVSELMQARNIVVDIEAKLKENNKVFDELTEWGQTVKRINSLYILRKVDKVLLMRQNNEFFNEIVLQLENEKLNVEVIEPRVEVQEKK